MNALNRWIDRTFGLPTDTGVMRARKRIIVIMQTLGYPLAIGYAIFFMSSPSYYFYGGLIVIGYIMVALLNLITLALWKRFTLHVWILTLSVLALGVGVHISQGGFYRSSVTLMYGLIAPAIVSVGIGRRAGAAVLGLFIALAVSLALFEPQIQQFSRNVPDDVVLILFTINLCAANFYIFGLMILLSEETEQALNRADDLLLNILPGPIAEQLKHSTATIAEGYDEVTVLFADIVDFTTMSANADPREVVNLLNDIFSDFDALAVKHGLEKIKTIGDAYMIAGGIPTPRPDHDQAIVAFALDMLKALENRRAWNDQPIRARIGINTGPVVAGVIGRQKFIYDLWGDAVNTASRMESHGLGNTIQVTESTYQRLKDRYEFESRGVVNVKGKGDMNTYLLRGRKSEGA